ncbi:MAG: AIR synthase-related protein [bacterium]|nr:AIR synthase-related protein [bacterium]
MKYAKTGVNYDLMDVLKRMAQKEGRKTILNLSLGFKEVSQSRGESAYIIEHKDSYLVTVQEGLGTKSLIADEMYKESGKSYYDSLAQDTVAMIVNDLVTVGAKPLIVQAYWGAGSPEWFKDTQRMKDLVSGWKKACDMSGAVWGGGETCTLTSIIAKDAFDLAGSSVGVIQPKKRLTLGNKIRAADRIIMFESSGIHANGLSLARAIADKLPQRYMAKMSNGVLYGEALLKPTIIYAKLIESLFIASIDIHYMVNITGHGWRKLMRYSKPFTYRITSTPSIPELFKFMMEHGPLDMKEAYGNLNMGAGFAIFISQKDIEKTIQIAKALKLKVFDAGVIEKGKKQVVIEPHGITFSEEELRVRN